LLGSFCLLVLLLILDSFSYVLDVYPEGEGVLVAVVFPKEVFYYGAIMKLYALSLVI